MRKIKNVEAGYFVYNDGDPSVGIYGYYEEFESAKALIQGANGQVDEYDLREHYDGVIDTVEKAIECFEDGDCTVIKFTTLYCIKHRVAFYSFDYCDECMEDQEVVRSEVVQRFNEAHS